MRFYDEYIEARNEFLYGFLLNLDKEEIIRLILGNSSDSYLDNMFDSLRSKHEMG